MLIKDEEKRDLKFKRKKSIPILSEFKFWRSI